MLITTDGDDYSSVSGIGETHLLAITGTEGSLHQCPINSLPFLDLESAVGGLLMTAPEGTLAPIACGADPNIHCSSTTSTLKCYNMVTAAANPIGSLTFRLDAASVTIYNETALWVTGGTDCGEYKLSSTDLFQAGGSTIAFLDLPQALSQHCIQRLHHGVIVYGGEDNFSDNVKTASIVYLTGPDSSSWNAVDSLNKGRRAHACGVLNVGPTMEFVVAAGGILDFEDLCLFCEYYFGGEDIVIDSVEFLAIHNGDVIGASWEQGPKLPTPLGNSASATTVDRSMLLIAGGVGELEAKDQSRNVYSLVCYETVSSCVWRKRAFELWHGLSSSVAMILPPFSSTLGIYLHI